MTGLLDPALDVPDGVPGIAFVPPAIEVLGHQAELDDEVRGEVLRPDLPPFFLPQADQGLFVLTHDDAGIGAADEGATVNRISYSYVWQSHRSLLLLDFGCVFR
jgi:hypothetical protein